LCVRGGGFTYIANVTTLGSELGGRKWVDMEKMWW